MSEFLFNHNTKIYYGKNKAKEIGKIFKSLGHANIFIVSDQNLKPLDITNIIIESLHKEEVLFTSYWDVQPDPDLESIDKLNSIIATSKATAVLAIGGGSVIDSAKAACALQSNPGKSDDYIYGGSKCIEKPIMPLVCIPTTAGSGSEVTKASVLSDHDKGKKASISHEYLAPLATIIDPIAYKDAPKSVTAATGMDALTHSIEAYVCLKSNPMSDMFAEKSIILITNNLVKSFIDGSDIEARSNMAFASTLGGLAFSNSSLGAVHGIAQSMGGVASIPHGIANAVMLPYVMEYNYKGNLEKFKKLANLLGVDTSNMTLEDAAKSSISAVRQLSNELKIPTKSSELGINEEMIPKIVEETMNYRLLQFNPVKLSYDDVTTIVKNSL